MVKNIVEVKDLKAYYQVFNGEVKAVDGLSFTVREGEILGLAGESGCGKSTLASVFVSLQPPLRYIAGEVRLLDQNIMQMPAAEFQRMRLRHISIIPQYALDAFSPTRKIKNYIADLVGDHGIKADAAFWEKVKTRLAMVNLDSSVLDRYPMELSGGMKQRVIMVISTILDPEFLIADEITSALDVSSQRFVATTLAHLRNQRIIGSALFITHDLSILYQIADRIMIMYAGNLMEIGPATEVICQPRHPYTQALIRSLPRLGVRYKKEKLHGIKGTPPSLLNIGNECRFRYRCPLAIDRCIEQPQPEQVGDEHFVACWRWAEIGSDVNVS